jgi:hypothetical protein
LRRLVSTVARGRYFWFRQFFLNIYIYIYVIFERVFIKKIFESFQKKIKSFKNF